MARKGVISLFKDTSLRFPQQILAGSNQNPSAAVPVITYIMKVKGRWSSILHGTTRMGCIQCHLVPEAKRLVGFPTLVGTLEADGKAIGGLRVGPKSALQTLMDFTAGSGEFTLTASRLGNSFSEGDVDISHSTAGRLVLIERNNGAGWREELRSRLGFGRVKIGEMLSPVEFGRLSPDVQLATLAMLPVYLHVVELSLNTSWGS